MDQDKYKVAKEYKFTINIMELETKYSMSPADVRTFKLTNNNIAPQFFIPPRNIEFTFSAEDQSIEVWDSPLAFDIESNEISFSLEGLQDLSAASMETVNSNQIKITLDKS
jgi:hypothetical protein